MRYTAIFTCSALLMAGSGYAMAEDASLVAAPTVDFATLDTDKDGMLIPSEVLVVGDLQLEFEQLDVNNDGKLSPAEFARWSRAANPEELVPDPSTGPSGSSGAQHVPAPD